MLIYFITYAFLLSVSKLSSKIKNNKMSLVLNLLGAIPLIFYGGMRSLNMGADASSYPVQVYMYSVNHSLVQTILHIQVEWLFVVIGWLCTKVFNSVNSILMVMQVITVFPIIIYFNRYHKRNAWYGIAIFLLLTYPWSMNIIRQTAASGILLMAFVYAKQGRFAPFLTLIVFSCGLHITSISGVIIWPIYRYYTSNKLHKTNIILYMICGTAAAIAFIFAPQLIHYFAQYKESYAYQIDHIGEGFVSNSYVALGIFCIILYIIINAYNDSHRLQDCLKYSSMACVYSTNIRPSFSLAVLSFYLSLLSIQSPALFRMGFMYSIFLPVYFSDALNFIKDKRLEFIVYMFSITICILYFYSTYVINGSSGAIPYRSDLLSI